MKSVFPRFIKRLPKADISLYGATVFLSQAKDHQIVFMEFEKDVELPKHSHGAQWEIVVEGKVDLIMNEKTQTYTKGDYFFIQKDVEHSGRIFAGYTSIAFFDQKDRYIEK